MAPAFVSESNLWLKRRHAESKVFPAAFVRLH
jgi:hypothetical protein